MIKIKITGYNTFGVKRFTKVADCKELKLYNIFGFGFWIIKNGATFQKGGAYVKKSLGK